MKKFKMESCNPILTPIKERLKLDIDDSGELVNPANYKRLVGSLRYLIVLVLTLFMELAIRILRFIKGSCGDSIFCYHTKDVELVVYIDSDWNGDTEQKKYFRLYISLMIKCVFMVIKETSC